MSELRQLRPVEEENSRLKRLVADLSLDIHIEPVALGRKISGTVIGETVGYKG